MPPLKEVLVVERRVALDFVDPIDANCLRLTTPNCDENVTWLVLTKPIAASQTQIDKFKDAISYNHPFQVNARP